MVSGLTTLEAFFGSPWIWAILALVVVWYGVVGAFGDWMIRRLVDRYPALGRPKDRLLAHVEVRLERIRRRGAAVREPEAKTKDSSG